MTMSPMAFPLPSSFRNKISQTNLVLGQGVVRNTDTEEGPRGGLCVLSQGWQQITMPAGLKVVLMRLNSILAQSTLPKLLDSKQN